jgi:hypothetical protein
LILPHRYLFVQTDLPGALAALLSQMVTGMVDQDPAHYLGGDAEEVGTVLEFLSGLIDKAEIRFVDQGGGLQGVARSLAPHVTASHAMQFGVNKVQEAVFSIGVAAGKALEKLGDFAAIRRGVVHRLKYSSGSAGTLVILLQWPVEKPV